MCRAAGVWIPVSDHQRSHSAWGRAGVGVQVKFCVYNAIRKKSERNMLCTLNYESTYSTWSWRWTPARVSSFGEQVQLLHPFQQQFNDESGARILRLCQFQQKKTRIAQVGILLLFSSDENTSSNRALFLSFIGNTTPLFDKTPTVRLFEHYDLVGPPVRLTLFMPLLCSFWRPRQKCF